MVYQNALEYLKENKKVVCNLYNQLFNKGVMINTITHTLSLLVKLCEYLKLEGVKIVFYAVEEFSNVSRTKLFEEMINFLNNSSMDIKINTMSLLSIMLEFSKDSILQTKILSHFKELDLISLLERNSDFDSEEFQIHLTKYQEFSGEVIKGSKLQVTIYLTIGCVI